MASLSYHVATLLLKLMEKNYLYKVERINGSLHFTYYKPGETEFNVHGKYDPSIEEITFNN